MAQFGVGNGFPYCLEKVDVSGLGYWETLGDIDIDSLDFMSDEEIKEDKKKSFKAAVGIAWGGSFCDPICDDTPIRMYLGDVNLKENFIGHGLNECTPPSATIDCVSETLGVSMDGWKEVTESQMPPVTYTTLTITGSGTEYNFRECNGANYNDFERSNSGSAICQIESDGSETTTGAVTQEYTFRDCGENGPEITSQGQSDIVTNACIFSSSQWHQSYTVTSETSAYFATSTLEGGEVRRTNTISNIETEEMATERAGNEGPEISDEPSSTWQTRSTGYFFTKQTCGYNVQCAGLKIGIEYSVLLQIRKRTAVQPPSNFGEWEDVDVDPVLFTATSNVHTIDDGGERIELDHIQGYEYEITDVTISKA